MKRYNSGIRLSDIYSNDASFYTEEYRAKWHNGRSNCIREHSKQKNKKSGSETFKLSLVFLERILALQVIMDLVHS
jgi:hypothetical protein